MVTADGASQAGIQPQVQRRGGVSVRVGYPGIFSSYGRVSRITATARKALPVRGPRCRLPLREDEKYIYLPQSTEISPWPRGAKMFDVPSGSNDGSKEGKDICPATVGYQVFIHLRSYALQQSKPGHLHAGPG